MPSKAREKARYEILLRDKRGRETPVTPRRSPRAKRAVARLVYDLRMVVALREQDRRRIERQAQRGEIE